MSKPRIYTACFHAPEDHHGTVCSIANRQPPGFGLPRLKIFAPDYLLGEYKSGEIDWAEYEWHYKYGLRIDSPLIDEWLATLTGDVTLCCWEIDPNECHRKWAAEFLFEHYGLGCEVMVR